MTITLKVSDNTKKEMIEFFEEYKREKTPPYAVFQADDADTVVTLYESGKAVFQGMSADISAQLWIERERHLNPLKKLETTNSEDKKDKKEDKKVDLNIYYKSAIGSDEVGTGDYFGPIVVTSAFVSKDNISFLEDLGVKDSKKMTDEKILEVVPKIIKKIPYKSIILTNKEYNERYSNDINMNKLKAILHNKVLFNLKNENPNYDIIIVDEFAKEYTYYSYLKDAPNIVRNISFYTKGEDKHLAVAAASLISRYIFIKEYEKLNKEYNIIFPKGAGELVDEVGRNIVKKYGKDELNKIAKITFKNTEKILGK